MQNSGYQSYQTANISTADRGKLIIMIYDHCLKWCRIARDDLQAQNLENMAKSVFKVQDGITELTCALDMEKGGEISSNLLSLYSFYNRHLSMAISKKDAQYIIEVETMLNELKQAWAQAVEIVRRENRDHIQNNGGNQLRMVG